MKIISFLLTEDELKEMDDEPDPEKASSKQKAKDELNLFSDTSSEDEEDEEEDKQLNQAGKQLKAMLKVFPIKVLIITC